MNFTGEDKSANFTEAFKSTPPSEAFNKEFSSSGSATVKSIVIDAFAVEDTSFCKSIAKSPKFNLLSVADDCKDAAEITSLFPEADAFNPRPALFILSASPDTVRLVRSSLGIRFKAFFRPSHFVSAEVRISEKKSSTFEIPSNFNFERASEKLESTFWPALEIASSTC